MITLDILSVVIGLSFVYMILSLITTTITEFVATLLAMRSWNLYSGIQTLLNDLEGTGLTKDFYNHPLIKSLSRPGRLSVRKVLPSYLDPHIFSLTLLDLIQNKGSVQAQNFKTLSKLATILKEINASQFPYNPDLQRQLQIILDGVQTVDQAHEALETWFNNMMETISGWYKRKAQVITVIVSCLVVIVFNGDTISLFNRLNTDPAVRGVLVSAAENAVRQDLVSTAPVENTDGEDTSPTAPPDLASVYEDISDLQSNINTTLQIVGWVFEPVKPEPPNVTGLDSATRESLEADYAEAVAQYEADLQTYTKSPLRLPRSQTEWFSKIIGLILSAVAVSLGAPFWFDILKRITNIRGTGSSVETKPQSPAPTDSATNDDSKVNTPVVVDTDDDEGVG